MLNQTLLLAEVIRQSDFMISQQAIDDYNLQNVQAWHGIRDFIRMHYDTGRTDTTFWKEALKLPVSDKYSELKKVWKYRTPRAIDFIDYKMGDSSHFGVYSWFAIGQAVGVIRPEATVTELLSLQPTQRQNLAKSLAEIKQRLDLA